MVWDLELEVAQADCRAVADYITVGRVKLVPFRAFNP